MKESEAELQKNIAIFLRVQYPDVIFHSDFGSGIKLRPYQAKMQKMQNGGKRAWPDMFIAEPRPNFEAKDGVMGCDKWNYGLFIELKKEGTRLKKKNGEWASDHIAEQAALLKALEEKGYIARFAVGFNEAVDLIDDYMGYDDEH